MRFLVTGANGFVGKPLCAELARQGQSVRAAVRSAGPTVDDTEVAVVGAVDGGTNWADALRDVDVVIHLAARVHVMKDNAADPLAEFLRVNMQGTENLAQQAAHAGVKRLVYVSSIKVNGEHPLPKLPLPRLIPRPRGSGAEYFYRIGYSRSTRPLRHLEMAGRTGVAAHCARNRAGGCHRAPAAGLRAGRKRQPASFATGRG